MTNNDFIFKKAFDEREDLKEYKRNALMLFALQLRFRIEDISLVASNSLTDGSDDKKVDLIHIDTEEKFAVIAQAYMSENEGKREANANKASDLNTAIAWILGMPIEKLPDSIKDQAEELQEAIKKGSILVIHIWYVHNCHESKNVEMALETVTHTAKNILDSRFPDHNVELHSQELGLNRIDALYKSIQIPILVEDSFDIPINGGFEVRENDWLAFVTYIPAKLLYDWFKKYEELLLSANVREYLGSRKADDNINHGIKNTAENDPGNFWVYNNGISALVHKYELLDSGKLLRIDGISIVNGAQTTGAIGSLASPPKKEALVQVRFIKCENENTVKDIVKYNNSQNRILAPDFRSNDEIQNRLRSEFEKLPSVTYQPRRGGIEDKIKHNPLALPSEVAGQALAAFHGNPEVAYHQKSKIWEDSSLYSRYFKENTTAKHILFAYSLLRAIEAKKKELSDKSNENKLTGLEEDQLNFFRKRGSLFLLASAISNCIEIFLGNKKIPDKYKLHFSGNIAPDYARTNWSPLVEIAISFTDTLNDGLADGIKNPSTVGTALKIFKSQVNAIKQPNLEIFKTFENKIENT